jgi:hypothetical protein
MVAAYIRPPETPGERSTVETHFEQFSADEERWLLPFSMRSSVGREPLSDLDRWNLPIEIATKLLPKSLRDKLEESALTGHPVNLLIVPGASLWSFPFLSLTLGKDTRLIDSAVVTLLPSVGMLQLEPQEENLPHQATRPSTAFFYGYGVAGLDLERQGLLESRLSVGASSPSTPAALMQCLGDGRSYDLEAISCHGDDSPGLRHSLRLDENDSLSAAHLLTLSCPRTLVLGACWSGQVSYKDGGEPFGLATVALLRGADSVISGIHALPSRATADVLAKLYWRVGTGDRPAVALRASQLAARASAPDPRLWAGLIFIGRR